MIINDVVFQSSLGDILSKLRSQLSCHDINLLQQPFIDTPDNIMVCCPYHKNGQERRPSAGIKKDDGTFHCFACGETHTLYEMISYCFGKDSVFGTFGWQWLLKNFVSVDVNSREPIKLDFDRGVKPNIVKQYVSEEELDSYRYYHPYMYKRKLTDQIIEMFDIGYDKNTECITFPVRDMRGNCLFVARRSVNTKFFNYPAGVEKPVYGIYELYKYSNVYTQSVIICESMLDALVFWTVGKCAVALNGVGNELQFKQLNKMPCRKFILCTDSDDAGMMARKRLRANLKNKIITEYILPNGKKDANECAIEELKSLQEVF